MVAHWKYSLLKNTWYIYMYSNLVELQGKIITFNKQIHPSAKHWQIACFWFQLHSNPWNCDCHLKNFRDWVVFRGLYTYPTSCAEPERLADKLWQDVDPKDFACKPEIRIPQAVVFSQPGANVTLSCFIIGNPMPDAKWVLKVQNSYNMYHYLKYTIRKALIQHLVDI